MHVTLAVGLLAKSLMQWELMGLTMAKSPSVRRRSILLSRSKCGNLRICGSYLSRAW
jgi:hypothetical protein